MCAEWLRLSTSHFELLTTAGERAGREALRHFERLRRVFPAQGPLPDDANAAVRIIAFHSQREYTPYRLNDSADAYHVGNGSRDYIVMPALGPQSLAVAAHEYAHVFERRQALKAPLWFSEGLAEVFSTISFQSGRATIGTPKPATLQRLRAKRWMPIAGVLAASDVAAFTREQAALFYAESWALVAHTLAGGRGLPPPEFGAGSAGRLERDLRAWVASSRFPLILLPDGRGDPDPSIAVEELPEVEARIALAELLGASGKLEQAGEAWRRLESEQPLDARIQAALGRLALAAGKTSEARRRFGRAVALGIRDAQLCEDYAALARDAGLPETDVIAAFERALALDPAMDDARYNLGLLHMNAGRYDAALSYLQGIRHLPSGRAFAYYTSLAHSQNELGLREDAVKSAAEARKHATTDEERTLADDLAWIARSEVVVQLSPDGPGILRRVPLRRALESEEVNPFIAPGDRIERREGTLTQVDCLEKEIRLTVSIGTGTLVLSIPDPGRVLVRKSGSGKFEFVCGPQEGRKVSVEYARGTNASSGITGILRGIELP